jgi:hypothetical protein
MKRPSSLSQIESDLLRKSAARHDYSRVYGESDCFTQHPRFQVCVLGFRGGPSIHRMSRFGQ